MREIKFRAWDEQYGMLSDEKLDMLHADIFTGLSHGKLVVARKADFENDWREFKVMQYTGFEGIYEGDILYGEETDEFGSVLSYWYGSVYWDEKKCAFYVKDDLEETYRLDDFDYIRIAGNIYENPALLAR